MPLKAVEFSWSWYLRRFLMLLERTGYIVNAVEWVFQSVLPGASVGVESIVECFGALKRGNHVRAAVV